MMYVNSKCLLWSDTVSWVTESHPTSKRMSIVTMMVILPVPPPSFRYNDVCVCQFKKMI